MGHRIDGFKRFISFFVIVAVLNFNIHLAFAGSFGAGGTAAPTTPETTRFVGELYEETATSQTAFIYVGDKRVAAVTNGTVSFYHPNHLGSTNIVTDAAGVLKELLEYKPYGEFAKDEKSAPEPVARRQFTGKQFDDGTGLYYYGARYYDPALGRFTTVDPTIQHPDDPQDLNRYSYVRNNPVNLIDPSGFGWFKKFINKWAGLFGWVGGVVKGVVTGDWSTLTNMTTAVASSAVFSGGNPLAIISSAITAGFMDTPPGHQFVRFMGEDVFDDAFGMPPFPASIMGNITSYAIVSSAVYIGLSSLDALNPYRGLDYRDPKNKAAMAKYKANERSGNGGSGANYIRTNKGGNAIFYREGEVASQNGWAENKFLGKITKALSINHTAAVVGTPNGFFDTALDSDLLNPFKTGDLWGMPWTGTCQQVTFKTLVENGMSGINALGAMTQHGGWTFYVTSGVYGVRADFGGVGLIQTTVDKNVNN